MVQEVLGAEYVGAAAIIGADTMVVSGGKIFGKPADVREAQAMLQEPFRPCAPGYHGCFGVARVCP